MANEQQLPQVERRYMTLAEAGNYLGGRSAEAMRMLVRRKRFVGLKIAGRTLLDKRELDAAFDAARVAGGTATK